MATLQYVRIYKVMATEEVVIDTPAPGYQAVYGQSQVDVCPEPWRFSDDNPDKEEYTKEIKSWSEFSPIASQHTDGGSAQFYYDDNGDIQCDSTWETILMPIAGILDRHEKRLNAWIEEELAKDTPDVTQVMKWQQELKSFTKLTDTEIYIIALDSLQYAGTEKPLIREKLQVLLGIPVNVAATEGDTEVSLAWDAVDGAASYKIYWGTETGVYSSDDTSATNSYTITGLTNDTPYFIAVTAIDGEAVESRKSDEQEVTPSA